MRGGVRVGAGKPSAPDLKDAEALLMHLQVKGALHMHRKKNARYKSGHLWELAFRQTTRCATDQCLKVPTTATAPTRR